MPAFDAGSLREPGHGRLDDTVAIAHRQHRHPHDLDRWRVVPDGGVEDRREKFGVRRNARPECYDGLRTVNERRATLRRRPSCAPERAVCVLHHEARPHGLEHGLGDAVGGFGPGPGKAVATSHGMVSRLSAERSSTRAQTSAARAERAWRRARERAAAGGRRAPGRAPRLGLVRLAEFLVGGSGRR